MVTIKFNLAAAAENRKRSRSVDTYQGNEEDQDSVISDGSEAGDTSQALPAHALPPSVAAGPAPKRGRGRPRKKARTEDLATQGGYSGASTPMSVGTPGSVDSPLPGTPSYSLAPQTDRFDRRKSVPMRVVEGRTYPLVGDELELDENDAGEEKIDRDGNLLGGREFKFATFNSSSRPNKDRQYCLSIDAARCVGYRDSLYFFRKHPLVYKVNCVQGEKELLIQQGKLHPNLRSRAVTMVTAHNLFKLFGAKIIRNGKNVTDDYDEVAALAQGLIRGTPAIHESYSKAESTSVGKGIQDVYQTESKSGRPAGSTMPRDLGGEIIKIQFGGSGIAPWAKWDPSGKQRKPPKDLGEQDWMVKYAQGVEVSNKAIRKWRTGHWGELEGWQVEEGQKKPKGVVNLHTAIPHVIAASQPTSASVERVHPHPMIDSVDTRNASTLGFSSVEVVTHTVEAQDEESEFEAAKRLRWQCPGGWDFPTDFGRDVGMASSVEA